MAEYAAIGGAQVNPPREPIASMAENLGRETMELGDRLQKLADRLNGPEPRPVEGLSGSKPEVLPVNLSMSRLNQNIRRCQAIVSVLEGSIG